MAFFRGSSLFSDSEASLAGQWNSRVLPPTFDRHMEKQMPERGTVGVRQLILGDRRPPSSSKSNSAPDMWLKQIGISILDGRALRTVCAVGRTKLGSNNGGRTLLITWSIMVVHG